MNIGWPEGIYLALNIFGLGCMCAKYPEPVEMRFFGAAFMWFAITLPLLWWGGFFA